VPHSQTICLLFLRPDFDLRTSLIIFGILYGAETDTLKSLTEIDSRPVDANNMENLLLLTEGTFQFKNIIEDIQVPK
jgi:hypothetical protein